MDYDKFQVGDKVWSETFGFAEIRQDNDYCLEAMNKLMAEGYLRDGLSITYDGRMLDFEARPRTFFHAVADTDEEMMAAIDKGLGLMRPKPRGRFEFKEGDKVLYFVAKKAVVGEITSTDSESNNYPIKVTLEDGGYESTTINGKEYDYNKVPSIVRLVDNEEIEKAKNMSPLEAMCFIAHKALEEDWKP